MVEKDGEEWTFTSSVSVYIDAELLKQAKALGIDVEAAATEGLAEAIAKKKAERWLARNGKAFDKLNEYIEAHGLPLESHRLF